MGGQELYSTWVSDVRSDRKHTLLTNPFRPTHPPSGEPLGFRVLSMGVIDEQKVGTVLNLQMQGDKRRFGAITVVLGYITEQQANA